ncbi:hypothetical protein [Aureispira anguillae]|uniref:Uncharacterized protein n=1 Tax=Aureispira anguillae TaxID=2864201 RepID=A0A915YHR1_9BACT|nr:hypothetical protein [Aureispira anguillae]BDS13415.1 hypothetical protein AsAng_0041520 [Aureispira anguillae]
MLGGQGSVMLKIATQGRNSRHSIFDDNEHSRGYQKKFRLKKISLRQKKAVASKIKRLKEDEVIRYKILAGCFFVFAIVLLLITVI